MTCKTVEEFINCIINENMHYNILYLENKEDYLQHSLCFKGIEEGNMAVNTEGTEYTPLSEGWSKKDPSF